jgi:hypothetical protein
MINFVDLWVYLSGSPLLWLTATLVAYLGRMPSPPPAAAIRSPIRF